MTYQKKTVNDFEMGKKKKKKNPGYLLNEIRGTVQHNFLSYLVL